MSVPHSDALLAGWEHGKTLPPLPPEVVAEAAAIAGPADPDVLRAGLEAKAGEAAA